MGDEKVKLVGSWFSPYTRRVELALKLKGIRFDYVEEDLKSKSSLLLESNPIHKKVPVLLYLNDPIVESLIILEFIEETWPDRYPLFPKQPLERAKSRVLAHLIDEKILRTVYHGLMRRGDQFEKASDEAIGQLKFLEDELNGKAFFGGESIGYLDMVAFFVIYWMEIWEDVAGRRLVCHEKVPNLRSWMKKLQEHEYVRSCLPERDMLLSHYNTRLQELRCS